jgi:hypothetical protein
MLRVLEKLNYYSSSVARKGAGGVPFSIFSPWAHCPFRSFVGSFKYFHEN